MLQAHPPDASKLPQQDIVGVTVLLLTCHYQDVVRACTRLEQTCAVSCFLVSCLQARPRHSCKPEWVGVESSASAATLRQCCNSSAAGC